MNSNIFLQKTEKPYISAKMIVLRGSMSNTVDGIAHLIEHIQSLSPSGKNTIQEFNEMIEKEDIVMINAYTSPERVSYEFKGLPGTEERIIYWMNRMKHEVPSEELLAREKKVVIDEIDKAIKSVEGSYKNKYGQAIVFTSIFPEIGNVPQFINLGTKESVSSITLKDIADYKNRFYTSENIIYTFSGDIDEKIIESCFEKDDMSISYEQFKRKENAKIFGILSDKNSMVTLGFRHTESLLADEFFESLYGFILSKIIRGELGLTYGVSPFGTDIAEVDFKGVQISHYEGRFEDYQKTVEEVKKIFFNDPQQYFTEEFYNYIVSRKKKSKVFSDFDPVDFDMGIFTYNAWKNKQHPYWEEYKKIIYETSYVDCINEIRKLQTEGEFVEVYIDKEEK